MWPKTKYYQLCEATSLPTTYCQSPQQCSSTHPDEHIPWFPPSHQVLPLLHKEPGSSHAELVGLGTCAPRIFSTPTKCSWDLWPAGFWQMLPSACSSIQMTPQPYGEKETAVNTNTWIRIVIVQQQSSSLSARWCTFSLSSCQSTA